VKKIYVLTFSLVAAALSVAIFNNSKSDVVAQDSTEKDSPKTELIMVPASEPSSTNLGLQTTPTSNEEIVPSKDPNLQGEGIVDCKVNQGTDACRDKRLKNYPDCPKESTSTQLCMVMVDKDKLSSNKVTEFESFLETANFPSTKVGKRCQYYGRPNVWCLILPADESNSVFGKLQSFSEAASNKTVKKFHGVEGGG
jgi:hypothetical protein